MRNYELMLIFPLEEDQCKAGFDDIKATLSEFGAVIENENHFGDRDLAYEIKKIKRGRFYLLNIKVNPAKVIDIDRKFKLNSVLLRFMFVRLDEEK
ncbi:MAG: 30S ribosomal protein S6 [Treponemataceae bacterium]